MISKKKKIFIILSISLVLLICCGGLLFFFLTQEKKDIGLCLSGGGAKGAYEIGVWKALEEEDYTSKIKGISGTSVGGLNAALLSCMSVDEAEDMWRNKIFTDGILGKDSETINSIKKIGSDFLSTTMENYENEKLSSAIFHAIISEGSKALMNVTEYAADLFNNPEKSQGLCSRDSLRALMKESVEFKKIYDKKMPDIYITTVRKAVKGTRVFKLQEQKEENIIPILLATSAIPVVFPSETLPADVVINGKEVGKEYEYYDGGFELGGGNNTNIEPLLKDEKIKTIFVVFLMSQNEMAQSEFYLKEVNRIKDSVKATEKQVRDLFNSRVSLLEQKQKDEIIKLEAQIEELKKAKKQNKSFSNKKQLNKEIDDQIDEIKETIKLMKKTKAKELPEYKELVDSANAEIQKKNDEYKAEYDELSRKRETELSYKPKEISNVIKQAEDAGKEIVVIVPSKNLGNLVTGTVNFDNGKLNEMVDLGYQDTKEILSKLSAEKATKKSLKRH